MIDGTRMSLTYNDPRRSSLSSDMYSCVTVLIRLIVYIVYAHSRPKLQIHDDGFEQLHQ